MPTLYDLNDQLQSEVAARTLLIERGFFRESELCPKCGESMRRDLSRWVFRCGKRSCNAERSLNKGTFLANTRLKANQVLMLGRLWLSNVSVKSAIELTGHSPNTVVDFWRFFRQLVVTTLEFEDTAIGGDGIIVEVDETKLGKRKYNQGHRVDGVWVIVGVERTECRKVFMVPVDTRDSATLRKIVFDHIRQGSIIHTDLWKGYNFIDECTFYDHGTVNHSRCFKDEDTGVHTNTVEGTNAGIKRRIPVRSRVKAGIGDHLGEFVWRRKHEKDELWDSFLQALVEIEYE
jgi:transposase-like protein